MLSGDPRETKIFGKDARVRLAAGTLAIRPKRSFGLSGDRTVSPVSG